MRAAKRRASSSAASLRARKRRITVPALPGEHTYYVSAIDTGYGGLVSVAGEGGYPTTVVTLPCPGEVVAANAPRGRAAGPSCV